MSHRTQPKDYGIRSFEMALLQDSEGPYGTSKPPQALGDLYLMSCSEDGEPGPFLLQAGFLYGLLALD
ncbi:hypothetical protein AAY473_028815 [Plecturocebus cupreus]